MTTSLKQVDIVMGCLSFQSCLTLCNPMDYTVQNIGVSSLSLLQGIFPTQVPTLGLNSGFPHCRQILYQLSHKKCPTILEWVDYPFSSKSSWPRNQTGISCNAGEFFTKRAIREALSNGLTYLKKQDNHKSKIYSKFTKKQENTSIIQKKTIIPQKVKHKGKERNEEKLRITWKTRFKMATYTSVSNYLKCPWTDRFIQ